MPSSVRVAIARTILRTGSEERFEKALGRLTPFEIRCRDRYGNTLLHEAAFDGRMNPVRMIIRRCAALPDVVNAHNRDEVTPLQMAWTKVEQSETPAEAYNYMAVAIILEQAGASLKGVNLSVRSRFLKEFSI